MNLNLKNHTYQTTLLVNISLPANKSQIIQEINTIKFDKAFLLDPRASCFYEFYNVVEGLNDTFTISRGIIDLGNQIAIGALFYKEMFASERFVKDAVDENISLNTQLNYKLKKYMSYRITVNPEREHQIDYVPNSLKFNISQDKGDFATMNGKFLMTPQPPFGSLCFTSQIPEPVLENQLITNQILNWQYNPIIIDSPYFDMSVHSSLRFKDNRPFTDSDFVNFGDKCGIVELNSQIIDDFNQKRLSYFLHELPKGYTVNMEYENIGSIDTIQTHCHYYDQDGKYLNTATNKVFDNVITFVGQLAASGPAEFFAIEIFNNFNVGFPNYQQPKRIFLTGESYEIKLDPGYYNGLDGIKTIFDKAIKGFKDNFDIDITITLNEVNNLVTITTKGDEIINFSFPEHPNSSNLFFGFDTYSVDIKNTITSPNHADLFSNSKFSNIFVVVDQLASSGYLSEKNIILNISPPDAFGQRMIYSDISFFKNFMPRANLNYLTIRIVDGEYQPIVNKSDIYINFKINCFNNDK